MVSLQLQNIFLRLNMEQVQMIADGLSKVKEEVEEQSLPLFAEEYDNIKQQLSTQGINMLEVDNVESADDEEYLKAEALMMTLFGLARQVDGPQGTEMARNLIKLQEILFGR